MSGAFTMPHALTGGPGYKANATYDEFLRKHSGFYRRPSAASNTMETDRRASQASLDANAAAAAQAVENVAATGTAGNNDRRGSVTVAEGCVATANSSKGSVALASDVNRKDGIFGFEPPSGRRMS